MQIQIVTPASKNLTPEQKFLFLAQDVRFERDDVRRAMARVRLARELNHMGEWDAAFEQLTLANKEAPDHPFVLRGLGLVVFRNGDIREGIRLYDRGRWQLPEFEKFKRDYPFREWQGQNIRGKRVLVWAEQGVGDQIMQARILSEMVACGAQLTIECEPRLIPLLSRSMPKAKFYTQTVPLVPELENGQFDFQTSMFSAWRYAKAPGSFAPSVQPDANLVRLYREAWDKNDPKSQRKINIGLSWSSKAQETGKRRSLALESLRLLARVGGDRVRFHNLQYGVSNPAALSQELNAPLWVDREVDPLKDIDKAAAQIAALDLVISIDNATVHMAGAMNVPTWVFLPKGSEFRWQKHQTDSVLYPSLRLFRNSDSQNWGLTISTMADALQEFLAQ